MSDVIVAAETILRVLDWYAWGALVIACVGVLFMRWIGVGND